MLHHFFLPHKKKNKHAKAHLLSGRALVTYVAVFVLLQIGFVALKKTQPGVLGTTSSITSQDIISLTNKERQTNGVLALKENTQLDAAAEEKAINMFAENYWAHVSPSGKSPWVWIEQSGYNYIYAGENLARSFSNSSDVVDAWMASKMGHRENLLNGRYQETGIAVEDGVINGEKTTLVVQLFGTPKGALAKNSEVGESGAATANTTLATNIPSASVPAGNPAVDAATTRKAPVPSVLSNLVTINPYAITRSFSVTLIILLTSLGLIDFFVMWRRGKLAFLHLRHLPHLGVISAAVLVLIVMRVGLVI